MKKFLNFLTLALLLLSSFSGISQEFDGNYTPISYTQLFDRIAAETDTVFRLSDHIVEYNESTDSLFSISYDSSIVVAKRTETLIIDKAIELNNVHFETSIIQGANGSIELKGGLINIRFNQKVSIESMLNLLIIRCEFMDEVSISRGRFSLRIGDYYQGNNMSIPNGIIVNENTFHANTTLLFVNLEKEDGLTSSVIIDGNKFILDKPMDDGIPEVFISSRDTDSFSFTNNVFGNKASIRINDRGNMTTTITNNDFRLNNASFLLDKGSENRAFDFSENTFKGIIELSIDELNDKHNVDFEQFNGKAISSEGFSPYLNTQDIPYSTSVSKRLQILDSLKVKYFHEERARTSKSLDAEVLMRGMFFKHYKNQFNNKKANLVYVEMKNLETERLQYEYVTDPTFETFFSLQINRFLKTFSAYGTNPAKAVVFSAYVILTFALVYLFFPNHWDSHGKNRIMDRYRFFLKYVNRDSGIHEVYLEEQKQDLLNAEDFKTYLLEQGKTAPKFFMATAMPLYKWSVAGTRTFSWFLEKMDFLKGKWSETEPSKQSGKSVLLITAFLIALTYDILIKMLNALMLSINTFTTLGFGEIPIKGLPRYLAIIQGFIGWFMLTIFSVSLISQLLN
jgi:hypothetical protein